MLIACGQQLLYALIAVRQAPVLRQKMRVVGGGHLLVGRCDKAARGTVVLRRLLKTEPALPVIARIPARCGGHAAQIIVCSAHRHLACGLEAYMPLHICRHNALHGRVVAREGFKQLLHRMGTIGLEPRLHRAVVGIQRRPAQGQRVFLGIYHLAVLLLRIADHGAMARAAQAQLHIGLAFDLEDFLAADKFLPAIWCAVLAGVLRVDLLQIQVLHIRVGIGKAPGHFCRAAQHHKWHAGQGCARHINGAQFRAIGSLACGCLQMGKVPDRWRTQAQVRVVGQQGLAAAGLAASHHPVVAAKAVVCTHIAHRGGRPLLQCGFDQGGRLADFLSLAFCAVNTKLLVQFGQINAGGRLLTGIGGHQLPELLGIQRLQQIQASELIAPVTTEIQRHHQRPAHGVFWLPS